MPAHGPGQILCGLCGGVNYSTFEVPDAPYPARTMVAKVLVVDDSCMMRELLALHLRNAGYAVSTAEDGVDGGYAVLRERPDLIICDIRMPNLDGYQFVSALRSDDAVRDIPVIFLTSEADAGRIAKDLGAVGYLPKPIRADTLLSLVAANVRDGVLPIG
jgi:CheY-like chemotaxis protein